MLRAEGYHILSLVLACIGAACGAGAAQHTGRYAGAVLLIAAIGVAVAAVRRGRRLRHAASGRQDHNRVESRVCELEARLKAASLEADAARSALAALSENACPAVAAAASIDEHESISQLRENLVRHLSHELRTPLTSIHACSELLLEDEPADSATRRDLFKIIHLESQRIALFIDSALGLTRLESGLLQVQKDRLSLGSLAERTLHDLRPLAVQHEVDLEVAPAAFDDAVMADEELLGNALRILLCNAIHQTPAGRRIAVSIIRNRARRTVGLQVYCQTVNPPKDVPLTFDRFYGGAETDEQRFTARGAGFELARKVIESVHGGTAFVTDRKDACVLELELPQVVHSPDDPAPREYAVAEVTHD